MLCGPNNEGLIGSLYSTFGIQYSYYLFVFFAYVIVWYFIQIKFPSVLFSLTIFYKFIKLLFPYKLLLRNIFLEMYYFLHSCEFWIVLYGRFLYSCSRDKIILENYVPVRFLIRMLSLNVRYSPVYVLYNSIPTIYNTPNCNDREYRNQLLTYNILFTDKRFWLGGGGGEQRWFFSYISIM